MAATLGTPAELRTALAQAEASATSAEEVKAKAAEDVQKALAELDRLRQLAENDPSQLAPMNTALEQHRKAVQHAEQVDGYLVDVHRRVGIAAAELDVAEATYNEDGTLPPLLSEQEVAARLDELAAEIENVVQRAMEEADRYDDRYREVHRKLQAARKRGYSIPGTTVFIPGGGIRESFRADGKTYTGEARDRLRYKVQDLARRA